MKVYLDNAATTQLDPLVLEAMMPYLTEHYGNPSSIHDFGRKTKSAIEQSRKTIASALNASVGEIFFTSGGTESANLVLRCAVEEKDVQRIITSKIEHHCVLHTLEALQQRDNLEVNYVLLDERGDVILEDLERLLRDGQGKKTLVALMHGNNEIGNLLDLEKVATLSKEYDALFMADTVQTIAHYPIDLQQIPVDYITGSAHKFHGPKGVGFVYIRNESTLPSLLKGGSQERNMRAGTENLYGIVGLAKATELGYAHLQQDSEYILGLKKYFWEGLRESIPDVQLNGPEVDKGLYTVLNIALPKTDHNDFLIYNLDINGIAASAGSACSSGSDQGSHVVSALPSGKGKVSVRFSFSRMNTKEELDYALEKIRKLMPVVF